MHPTTHADTLAQLNAELAQARESRAYYDRVASEARDQADEQTSPNARQAWINQCARYRAQAVVYANRIFELVREIAALAPPAEVVVTADQAAAMDDMAAFATGLRA